MIKSDEYSFSGGSYQTFRSLDGLRGIAALLVAFYHWNVFHWMFSFYGYMAVDLFFVLSGFILAHRYLYACSIAKESDFLVARFARLYPMHLFALFFLLLCMCILMERCQHMQMVHFLPSFSSSP